MTKREMENIIKGLVDKAPAAVAAQIPGWDALAASVAPPPPDPKKNREPRPLTVTVETVEPKAGDTWAAFKVLHVSNGANGRYYRGKKLDARNLAAVLTFLGFKPEQVSALIQRAGL